MANGKNNFALRSTVASNVAGKIVNIGDAQNPVLLYGCAAYAAARLDSRAGGQTAKRSKRQCAMIHQIEAAPVDLRQSIGQKRRNIGQVGNRIERFIEQRGRL